MKKCPNCDKTFDDGMKFCQTDGTPLVEVSDVVKNDPFKTMVAGKDEIASSIPPDPFKTMVAPPLQKDEKEILELPEEPDFLKTMVSSPPSAKKTESANEEKKQEQNVSPPLSPFSDPITSGSFNQESSDEKFSSGGKSSFSKDENSQPDSEYSPPENPVSESLYDVPSNSPIPSPFEESMIGYEPPPKPSFNEPDSNFDRNQNQFNQQFSPIKEAEIKAEALNTPYAEQAHQPIEQSNWTPPPAPDSNWQNQQIGQNTPFQPPVVAQNQTLAIVSLVLGILSIPCCGFIVFGIGAVVTGFMAKSKAEQNPNEFGGKSLALGGIIVGGITIILGIIFNIVYLFIGLPMNF